MPPREAPTGAGNPPGPRAPVAYRLAALPDPVGDVGEGHQVLVEDPQRREPHRFERQHRAGHGLGLGLGERRRLPVEPRDRDTVLNTERVTALNPDRAATLDLNRVTLDRVTEPNAAPRPERITALDAVLEPDRQPALDAERGVVEARRHDAVQLPLGRPAIEHDHEHLRAHERQLKL